MLPPLPMPFKEAVADYLKVKQEEPDTQPRHHATKRRR
jgi:hypothetical protein